MRDLYYSNDSHLSTRGQLVFGQRVLDWVRQHALVPPPASPQLP